jgi:hypothetical protein
LIPNGLWLFPKIKPALRDEDFRILKISKICEYGNESYFTTGVPKVLPTVEVFHNRVSKSVTNS